MPKENNKVFIIAEIAQAHDGSLGMAHAFIDAAAKAGADAVKFQTHIASEESTPAEPWRIKFSRQDKTRYDYWKRMEFTEEQWHELKKHADEKNIEFLSSPFSAAAVELLTRAGVRKWKIASGEVTNVQLFDSIAKTGFPVLLSTGMSGMDEIDNAVNIIKQKNLGLTLLQCTSMYPTPPEKLGLNMIPLFREKYNCKVGLSDHSGTIYAGLAAAAIGIDALEVHLTLSKDMFGPDVPVSLEPSEFARLVEGVRFIDKAVSNPVDKNAIAEELKDMKKLFNKSIVAKSEITEGSILKEDNIAFKKPGTGLPPADISKVLGKRTKRLIHADELILPEDLE
jgi:N-acetylneuraminate synthase